jgi:hypothetical protein
MLEAEQVQSVEEYELLNTAYKDAKVALSNSKTEIENASVRPNECLLILE